MRHTSNELYVDIVESLSVTMAPSGRLLSALVSGTIAFKAKISGVPDLLLALSTPGGPQAIGRKIALPVFHPCVRLARWRERPGELSFVPPDGRFILAGYEVDLIPIDPDQDQPPTHMEKVFLPAIVDLRKSLGPTGADFEVRLTLNTHFPGFSTSSGSSSGVGAPRTGGASSSVPSFLGGSGGAGIGSGTSSAPTLSEVVVTVPISKKVRNITNMQASRGEAQFLPGSDYLEWRIPTGKDAGTVSGTPTLRCTLTGHSSADEDFDDFDDDNEQDNGADDALEANVNLLQGYYEAPSSYQDVDATGIGSERRRRLDRSGGGGDGTSNSGKKRKTKKKKKSKKAKAAAAASSESPAPEGLTTLGESLAAADLTLSNNGDESADALFPSSNDDGSAIAQPHPHPPPIPSETAQSATGRALPHSAGIVPGVSPSPSPSPAPTPALGSGPGSGPGSIFYTQVRKSKKELNASLMPNSAAVSFSVRGWLPSGIRVESLSVDPLRSRGLGEGVKPYKGVKYVCVSRRGVERRF